MIKAGIITVINPFDEMKKHGFEKEFQKLIGYRAREIKQLLTKEKRPKCSRPQIRYNSVGEPVITHRSILNNYELFGRKDKASIYMDERTGFKQKIIGSQEARSEAVNSIMYDSAVLLSKRYGAVPLAANKVHDLEFSTQVKTGDYLLLDDLFLSNDRLQEKLEEVSSQPANGGFRIARKAMVEYLPTFENIAFHDILKIRKNSSDELEAFRVYTEELAKTIISDDSKEQIRIDEIVTCKIIPALKELERKVNFSKQEYPRRILKKSMQTIAASSAVGTFMSTQFKGIPLYNGLLVVLVIALGTAGALALIETFFETKKIKKNSALTFLLEMSRAFCGQ